MTRTETRFLPGLHINIFIGSSFISCYVLCTYLHTLSFNTNSSIIGRLFLFYWCSSPNQCPRKRSNSHPLCLHFCSWQKLYNITSSNSQNLHWVHLHGYWDIQFPAQHITLILSAVTSAARQRADCSTEAPFHRNLMSLFILGLEWILPLEQPGTSLGIPRSSLSVLY